MQRGVLVLVCENKRGLLHSAAAYLSSLGAEIESSICKVRGSRATLHLEYRASEVDHAAIRDGRVEFERSHGGMCEIHGTGSDELPGYSPKLYSFTVNSDDAPGLLERITNVVAGFKIEIFAHRGTVLRDDNGRYKQIYFVYLPHNQPDEPEKRFNKDFVNNALQKASESYNGNLLRPLHEEASWIDLDPF